MSYQITILKQENTTGWIGEQDIYEGKFSKCDISDAQKLIMELQMIMYKIFV